MSVAFLIAAHAEPKLLARLARRLSAPGCDVFIHIDSKADIDAFVGQLPQQDSIHYISDRVSVKWGGWSQVQATINLLKAATAHSQDISRFVLLSGGCYPLVRTDKIHDRLTSEEFEYISVEKMPNLAIGKPLTRLTKYFVEGGARTRGLTAAAIRIVNRLALLLPDRPIARLLNGRSPFAGSNWWALTRKAVDIVLESYDSDKKLNELYRFSKCPDESYFHTILSNSVRKDLIRPTLTYADWDDPKIRPAYVKESHLDALLTFQSDDRDAPYLFLRKFDSRNSELLDLLDKRINEARI